MRPIFGMLLAALLAVPQVSLAKHPTRVEVRERLADLLASEEFTQVDFPATTFDEAMERIYLAVDTYLDKAGKEMGWDEVEEFGVEILSALNEHKIFFDEHDLVGKTVVAVRNAEEAKQLGELVWEVAKMLRGAHVGRGVEIRAAAKRVFEAMHPYAGTGESLVTQYLVKLRSMTKSEKRHLLKYALE